MVCCYYRFFRRQKVLTKYRREITFSLLYLICIALQISVDFSLNLVKSRLESGLPKPENIIFPKKCFFQKSVTVHHFINQKRVSVEFFNEFWKFNKEWDYVKSVRIWSFSGPYFPLFGLNKEIYGVNIRIQSECGKILTRKTANPDTFHAV